MKILWVKSDFLHPTERGGQIRTLQMLKQLHRRHEIHYAALQRADQPGGVERSVEYCTKSYPVPHHVPSRSEMRFWWQIGTTMFSRLPLAVSHHRSEGLRRQVAELSKRERFDAVICDFLSASPNLPDLAGAVLFQHNVEAQIWKRRLEHATFFPTREYLRSQYEKMRCYEGKVCRAVKRVIAVSDQDAQTMRSEYGVPCVQAVSTGVDLDYFTPSGDVQRTPNVVFVGAMDWPPNVDGIHWFVSEVLPRIRKRRADCGLTIAGRHPDSSISRLARKHSGIRVTGTVPDVRPYLREAAVSIVPLRIGGGTRLKIFEAMAAKIPVVSTTIGAEGLNLADEKTIRIADTPADFAEHCLELLGDAEGARRIAENAWNMVSACYSWEVASHEFERLLV